MYIQHILGYADKASDGRKWILRFLLKVFLVLSRRGKKSNEFEKVEENHIYHFFILSKTLKNDIIDKEMH